MFLSNLPPSKRVLYLGIAFIIIAAIAILLAILFPEQRNFFRMLASRIFRNL